VKLPPANSCRPSGAAASDSTWVNWPPATILFPIWTMAATLPSRTCGVQSAGLLDTTAGCGTFTAAPGCAIRPTRTAADSSTNQDTTTHAVVSYRSIG
jgi:hypothetical protein